jgi:hypothetical protein
MEKKLPTPIVSDDSVLVLSDDSGDSDDDDSDSGSGRSSGSSGGKRFIDLEN